MDPRFQSSFIPKSPAETGALKAAGDVNLLLVLGIVIFIITGAAGGGVFLYRLSLEKANKSKDEQIKAARASFGLEIIEDLKSRARQLSGGAKIVGAHLAPTALFTLLEEHTLKTVRFKTLSLSQGSEVALTMSGEAQSFNSVAYQSEVFAGLTKEFIRPVFSNFAIQENGYIAFSFSGFINPQVVSYARTLSEFAPDDSREGGEDDSPDLIIE